MAVAKAQIESVQMRGAGQFDALAARAPDVLKKTRVDRAAAAGDELDVIVEVGTIRRGCPFEIGAPLAARAGFDGVRDDFPERRVGEKNIGQLAWGRRIGTGQLDGGGGAHAFVVRRVRGHCRRWLVIDADGRSETRKREITVKPGVVAGPIGDTNPRMIVATRERHGPCIGQRQRIGKEHAQVAILRTDIGSRSVVAEGDRVAIRGKNRRLRLLRESSVADIDADADSELIRSARDVSPLGQLQSSAPALLVGLRAIVGRLIELWQTGVAIDCAVSVIDVAADIVVAIVAVVGVATKQD